MALGRVAPVGSSGSVQARKTRSLVHTDGTMRYRAAALVTSPNSTRIIKLSRSLPLSASAVKLSECVCLAVIILSSWVLTYQLRISRQRRLLQSEWASGQVRSSHVKTQWLRHWRSPRPPSCASPTKWSTIPDAPSTDEGYGYVYVYIMYVLCMYR